MINNFSEALKFQREQQDVAVRIGAYLAPIRDFIDKSESNQPYADDVNNIRRLQPHVGDQKFLKEILHFLIRYNYEAYGSMIRDPYHRFASLLAIQTLPSKRSATKDFIAEMKRMYSIASEGLIAISQIPLPLIDINIKAQFPFQAYCFFVHLFAEVKEFIYLIDPYIDITIFHLYFYQLPSTSKIQIASSSDKWNKNVREQIEVVESLFLAEYKNYVRKDCAELHDRFMITETAAFQLGGSLKDAAKKADFSIVQISEERRLELINAYFK